MGSFYTNITLRTTQRGAVRDHLAAAQRKAYISPVVGGALVVFDQASEEQDLEELGRIASHLSQRCSCPALALMIHDDDILLYRLYEKGALVDQYTSAPEYFEGGDAHPAGGDAARLGTAFGRPEVKDALEEILRRSKDAPEAYTFETDRHTDLVRVLGLPSAAVGTGYNYIEANELPPELAADDLIRVG